MTTMIQLNPNLSVATPPPSASAASGSKLAALLGAGADLATVIFAMQIEQYDSLVRKGLDEIDQTRKLRDSISAAIDRLRGLKAFIATTGKENGGPDQQYVHWSTTPGAEKTNPGFDGYDSLREIPRMPDFKQNADGSVTVVYGDKLGHEEVCMDDGVTRHKICMADVDAAINKLQTKAQSLDSDREIKMIMLNQYLNKKEQATTQLTNIIKKTHDTRSAIIANLK
jgi:hypothetical protein